MERESFPQWLVVALWVCLWSIWGQIAAAFLPIPTPWTWWVCGSATLCGAIFGAYFTQADVMPSAVGSGVGCWVATFCYFAAADFILEQPLPFTGTTEDFYLQFTFETVIYPGLAMLFGFCCGALAGGLAHWWLPDPPRS